MASMSYCLFENTIGELARCVELMENARSMKDLELNQYELLAFQSMWRVARDFMAEHERLMSAQLEDDIQDVEEAL